MNAVMYSVPLDKLYEVMFSCQYNEDSEYCPIILKIIDDDIKRNNGGLEYLLQVWSSKGDLLFERPLEKPISNWNISKDKFIFQETRESPIIYIVRLFLDKEPHLHKFKLPEHVTKNGINSYFENGHFIVPPEDHNAASEDSSLEE